MIRVEHLYKSFGDIHAVKDVTFNVAKGEVVGLLGPNGAGKTTTMRIITGYMSADRGEVYLDDVPVFSDSLKTRSMIGYLPENAPLYVDMEVTDFLSYVAAVRGISGTEVPKRLREMVDMCDLGDVVGRPIGQLSRGYKQRVGLAQALIHHPAILILDEPTSGLDPNQITEIRNLIKRIGEERTVVLSTHIMQEVEATCSRAFIVNEGELVGQGSLQELQRQRHGVTRYHLIINAKQADLQEKIKNIVGMNIVDFETEQNEDWQKIVLHSDKKESSGEEIYKWVVENGWMLKELHEEKASLEDTFRALTIGK
jgi:ABC-2 type transport system ATP-binding protein